MKQLKASITMGKMFDMELPLRGADSIYRSFLTRMLPVKDAAGNSIQWFGSEEDNISASATNDKALGRQVRFFWDGRQISDRELPLQRAVAENRVISSMELEVQLPSGRRWSAKASGAPMIKKATLSAALP